jgi:predicted phosphohydrolase
VGGSRVFAISDLHLAPRYGAPAPVDVNPAWRDYPRKLIENWQDQIAEHDIVLMPGDIAESTGPALQAAVSLLDRLPGRKIISPGNHDPEVLFASAGSIGKRGSIVPVSGDHVERIQWREDRTALVVGALGSWETDSGYEGLKPEVRARPSGALEAALKRARIMRAETGDPREPIVLLHHYPPLIPRRVDGAVAPKPTPTSDLIERAGVSLCLTGHLHHPSRWDSTVHGQRGQTRYELVSGDYLAWRPLEVTDFLDAAWG